jgi:acetoin utilization deacetylase AcuC-like enzyme
MAKFARLPEVLVGDGLARWEDFLCPEPVKPDALKRVHDETYVDDVLAADVEASRERRIGLPIKPDVTERSRHAVGGTLLAARLALSETGLACNTAGGSHHAAREGGAGFCVFNDVGVAAAALLAEGMARRIVVIDLDVHQGDGTADIFKDEARVLTVSMHAEKNFPVRKVAGDIDVGLADGLDDAGYLDALEALLDRVLARGPFDLAFYNAGVDPHRDDRLGRLALSDAGLAERDRRVLSRLIKAHIPVTGVIGGGYGEAETVARRHSFLHRAALKVAKDLAPWAGRMVSSR